jgi:outer membrane protein OmpA-like peptidoglycan-associated protein
MSKPIRYARGGVKVTIGHASTVSLPPRSFHGRLTCMYFDTSKCFLLPTAMTGVRNLRRYYDQHPGLKILVNGHTDKVDTDANNLVLSEERARSIAAFLQDQVDDWLAWYGADKPFGKRWGTREDQYMLATLTDATGALYLAAPISGIPDGAMRDATTRFQQANGLTADGQAGPDTRRALVAQYMAQDGTSLPPGTELLTHGCGESHPIDQTEDADLGNRRVEVFLFDGPIDPPPQSPCRPGGCAEYAQWVAQAIEQIDLCHTRHRVARGAHRAGPERPRTAPHDGRADPQSPVD